MSSQSSQETKVVCKLYPKNKSQDKKDDNPRISNLKIEEENKEEILKKVVKKAKVVGLVLGAD